MRMNDDAFYAQVAAEIQAEQLEPGLWTRAFSETNGDVNKAKALYIRYRVAQLAGRPIEQDEGITLAKIFRFFLTLFLAFATIMATIGLLNVRGGDNQFIGILGIGIFGICTYASAKPFFRKRRG